MHGLPGPAFDGVIEAIADVVDYPDGKAIVLDITWAG